MITKNGICYNLQKSPYKTECENVTFVFSSELHKTKFEKQRKAHRKKINESLTKRFGISVDVSLLADVVLYKRIETRGFLLESKEGNFECVNDITCASMTLTGN